MSLPAWALDIICGIFLLANSWVFKSAPMDQYGRMTGTWMPAFGFLLIIIFAWVVYLLLIGVQFGLTEFLFHRRWSDKY